MLHDVTNRAESTWPDNLSLAVIVAGALYAAGLITTGRFVGDEVFGALGFGPGSAGITGGEALDYTTFVFGGGR